MYKILIAVTLLVASLNVMASNQWYQGHVTNIITYKNDGSFEVQIDNSTINNTCLYSRVDFLVDDMGLERTKAALSMAMASFLTGKLFGVVVDLPSPGQICHASPTASQGTSITSE